MPIRMTDLPRGRAIVANMLFQFPLGAPRHIVISANSEVGDSSYRDRGVKELRGEPRIYLVLACKAGLSASKEHPVQRFTFRHQGPVLKLQWAE